MCDVELIGIKRTLSLYNPQVFRTISDNYSLVLPTEILLQHIIIIIIIMYFKYSIFGLRGFNAANDVF